MKLLTQSCLILVSVATAEVSGALFYSADVGTNELVTIDSETGEVNVVGSFGVDMGLTSMEWVDGKLYVLDSPHPTGFPPPSLIRSTLYEVDTTTGAATELFQMRVGSNFGVYVDAIAQRGDDVFVSFEIGPSGPGSSHLGLLANDGSITDLGNQGFDVDSLAVDGDGNLFGVDFIGVGGGGPFGELYSLEPASFIGIGNAFQQGHTIVNDRLYFVGAADDVARSRAIGFTDLSTGAVQDVVLTDRFGLYWGLASAEPVERRAVPDGGTSVALLGLALLGMGVARRTGLQK